MKFAQYLSFLLIASTLTFATYGCQTTAPATRGYLLAADGENVTTLVVSERLTTQQVRDAVVHSLIARSWSVQQESPNKIQASLNHRRIEALLNIEISDGEIKIVSNSTDDRGVPYVPARWINFLTRDINTRLARELATQ